MPTTSSPMKQLISRAVQGLVAVLLLLWSLDVLQWSTKRIALLMLVSITLSIVWLVKLVLFDGSPDSWLGQRRKQLTLAFATLWLGTVALTIMFAFVKTGPTA